MKSLKQNYDKHLVITLIVLVALPILLGFSTFILINQEQVITSSILTFNDPEIGINFLYSLYLLQFVIFVVMLIFYPLYPLIPSIENHLSKRDLKSALTEYQVLKKIVYALLPVFFFVVALSLIGTGISSVSAGQVTNSSNQNNLGIIDQLPYSDVTVSILAALFLALASALLRIILLNRSKHFKFYLARLSFRAMSRVEDDVERVKYLIDGLSFYNKYIRRSLRLQISDLKIIYSKIIADASVDKNRWMKELSQAFEDNDKLRPIRCLTGLFNITDPEHFLVKESVGKKWEERITVIGALGSAIAAVIAVIALYYADASLRLLLPK
jgi:hypothetical protein